MKYSKPHLPYDQQLQLLVRRGMVFTDQRAAVEALRHIGYYRFSAYTYPFRKWSDSDATGGQHPQRVDTFVDGSTFEGALALHNFDQKLRRCLANGLEEVEIGLRAAITYQLGKTHPFGHITEAALDPDGCARVVDPKVGTTAHERFKANFERQKADACEEEFVKHFRVKYDGEMPIWVAAEFMSLGLLVQLFSLLNNDDAKKIAQTLAVRDRRLAHKYLKALNVLRNVCAHHCRVWNRSTVFPPANPPANLAHPRIHHLCGANQHRVYPLAALTAHFAIQLNPATNWPRKFKEVMKDFPAGLGMSPEAQMGCPQGWRDLAIWAYDPKAVKSAR